MTYSLSLFILISLQKYNFLTNPPNILKEKVAETRKFIKILPTPSIASPLRERLERAYILIP